MKKRQKILLPQNKKINLSHSAKADVKIVTTALLQNSTKTQADTEKPYNRVGLTFKNKLK